MNVAWQVCFWAAVAVCVCDVVAYKIVNRRNKARGRIAENFIKQQFNVFVLCVLLLALAFVFFMVSDIRGC